MAVPFLADNLGLRHHAPAVSAARAASSPSRGGTRPRSPPCRSARAAWHRQTARRDPTESDHGRSDWRAVGRGWADAREALLAAAQSRQRPTRTRREADSHGTPDASESSYRGRAAAGGAAGFVAAPIRRCGGSSAPLLGRSARPLAAAAPVVPGHEGLEQSRDGASFGRIEDNDSKRLRRLEGGEQFSRRNVGVRHGWR